ncbi:hypothetical protein ACG04R_23205 [Roseateles sp. BYS78W]|uniref:DUF2971 domain-containing protein n=1 Tax=Pelomonas candidula TaxID=3299025 RepID=A0ABW7HIV7_9BURK
METYRKAKGLETLLALCLSERAETYHHWKVFTDRNNGVCILFHRTKLRDAMKKSKVNLRRMSYLTFSELDAETIPTARLPYLKRFAFKDEGEVRAVYENAKKEAELKKVPIDLGVIEGISLNPWMAKPVADSIIAIIEQMTPNLPFEITRSNLIESRVWRKFAEKYPEQS